MYRTILLCFALTLQIGAQDLDDLEALEGGGPVLDFSGLKGEERKTAVLKACETTDPDSAITLISLFTDPSDRDSSETLQRVFETLMRLKCRDIGEELRQIMGMPDPQLQGFAFRIYARTFAKKAASELLGRISQTQSVARNELFIALRDCPDPSVARHLKRLAQSGDVTVSLYLTLLRLGDADYSAQILNYYGSASQQIRGLSEALIYPSDRRKADRDREHMRRLIKEKEDIRTELAQLPAKVIPAFAAAAAKIRNADVWSLLSVMFPRIAGNDKAHLFAPLLDSPSIELTTVVLNGIVNSNYAKKDELLPTVLRRLSSSSAAELRKLSVRHSRFLPDNERTELVHRMLNDPDKWVRVECLDKLGEWQASDRKLQVTNILASTADEDVRWSAENALEQMK